MSETVDLSVLVKRVPTSYVGRPQELVMHVSGSDVIKGEPKLLQKLLGSISESWVLTRSPPTNTEIRGVLLRQQVEFQNGELALLDIEYSRVRIGSGGEAKLVAAVRGTTDVQQIRQIFETRLSNIVGELVRLEAQGSRGAWRSVKQHLVSGVVQRVREELGLDAQVTLSASGRAGRLAHGSFTWNYSLLEIDEPQPFLIELTTEDDPASLPLRVPEDMRGEELRLVDEALRRQCAKLRLETLLRAPRDARSAFRAEIDRALVVLARRVASEKISLAPDAPPVEQLRVETKIEVGCATTSICLGLGLLLRRVDADKARSFELQAKDGVEGSIRARAREIAELEVSAATLDVLFLDNDALLGRIRDELARWIFAETGYECLHGRVELRTPRPVAPQHVVLTVPLRVEPSAGRTVELEIRATAQLAAERQWLRRGAPELKQAWQDMLEERARALLHTLDEAKAARSKEDVAQQLLYVLAALGKQDGYGQPVLDVAWKSTIPLDERRIPVHVDGQYSHSGSGDQLVRVEAHGELAISDEWTYFAWRGARDRGWVEPVLDAMVKQELGFRSRQDLLLERDAIVRAIEHRFAREVGRRGYRVVRLSVGDMRPPGREPKPRLEPPVKLVTPLLRDDDQAMWSGQIAFALHDRTRWTRAGEPDGEASIHDWAGHAFAAACRATTPGQVDVDPESVASAFEGLLRQELERYGFALVGLDGRVTATNGPFPSKEVTEEFECRVGQRMVDVRATVRLRLESHQRWRAAPERDLEAWIGRNVRDVVKDVLLPMSFAELLDDVVQVHNHGAARVAGLVKKELEARAQKLGYAVTQVLTFPDEEARGLLRGFEIPLERIFPTCMSERDVPLGITISGRFASFASREVRDILSRGESVTAWLGEQVERVLARELIELTPIQVFFRWDKDVGDHRGILVGRAVDALAAIGVVEPRVSLTLRAPTYIEKIRELCGGGLYPFELRLDYDVYHGAHELHGKFRVDGLDERGVDHLFARTQPLTASDIGWAIAEHLASKLDELDEEQLVESRSSLVDSQQRVVGDFCGETFGLAIRLVSLTREKSIIHRVGWGTRDDAAKERIHLLEINEVVRKRELKALEQGVSSAAARPAAYELVAAGPAPTAALAHHPGGTPELLGDLIVLEVRPPHGGYRSAEAQCHLEITARVEARPRLHAAVPDRTTLEDGVRVALARWLSTIDPATFWTMFYDIDEGGSLAARARDVVERATSTMLEGAAAPKVSIEVPRWKKLEELDQLTKGRDLEFGELGVELAGGSIRGIARAQCAIAGPAKGYWERLERNLPSRESFVKWFMSWTAECLRSLSEERARGDLRAHLVERFAADAATRFGLVATLRQLGVDLDRERRAKIYGQLEAIRQRVSALSVKPDEASRKKVAELRQQAQQLEEQLEPHPSPEEVTKP